MGATSWTRKTLAPRSSASTVVATVAATRSWGSSRPVRRPRNDLRDVPITTGKPSVDDPVQAAQQLEVVLERLAEADARVDHDALLAHALADGERDALLEEGADVVDDVVVAGVVLHRPRLAQHVHQAAVAPAVGHEAGHLGLWRNAVTSLT